MVLLCPGIGLAVIVFYTAFRHHADRSDWQMLPRVLAKPILKDFR